MYRNKGSLVMTEESSYIIHGKNDRCQSDMRIKHFINFIKHNKVIWSVQRNRILHVPLKVRISLYQL